MFIKNLSNFLIKLEEEDVSDLNVVKLRLSKINNIYLKDLLESKSILESRGIKSVLRLESKS